jgi:hypothetical protein
MTQINSTWRIVGRDSITEDQSKAFLKGLQEEGFRKDLELGMRLSLKGGV